jgi:hypothetical protein
MKKLILSNTNLSPNDRIRNPCIFNLNNVELTVVIDSSSEIEALLKAKGKR